ncbi:MAG: DUF1573 domain-containing protein [Planctomycetia bacterium]|nr:DUF1573 domain-containing protein [Planctomycetia bacterium]
MRRFAKHLCSALSFALLLVVMSSASVFAAQGVFSETGYDFKGIPRGTTPRHSFVFTNTTSSELRLVSARVSCQCTKVFIPEKRVYKPGERGEVVAMIDAVRFTGPRNVTVTVVFQSGATTFEIPLKVVGQILENVRLQPDKLNFLVEDRSANNSEIDETEASKRTQKVQALYPSYNETIARVESSNPYVEVKRGQPQATNSGTVTPLFVTIKDNAPAGNINAVVRLWSNGAYSSAPLTLNVAATVRAPLSASPSTLTFFTSQSGEKIDKNLVVTGATEFAVKRVSSDSKAIRCNVAQSSVRPAKVCVLPITFDPAALGDESASPKLRIETTDGRVLVVQTQISSGNFALAKKGEQEDNKGEQEDVSENEVVSDPNHPFNFTEEQSQTEVAENESTQEASDDDAFDESKPMGVAVSSKGQKKRDASPMTLKEERRTPAPVSYANSAGQYRAPYVPVAPSVRPWF